MSKGDILALLLLTLLGVAGIWLGVLFLYGIWTGLQRSWRRQPREIEKR